MMQALVIAHASYGHNSFFKGNYLFRQSTEADGILDYLVFARRYVMECEERHGVAAVEDVLDSCHALMRYGVDRYKRAAQALARQGESARGAPRERPASASSTTCGARCPPPRPAPRRPQPSAIPAEPRRTSSTSSRRTRPSSRPGSGSWCASCASSRSISIPQGQTKVMNEGWATFWHYTILNRLYDKGLVNDALHARVPAVPHQRRHPARLRRARLRTASTPTRSGSR